MAANIHIARAEIEAAILATVPDVEPHIRFKRASYECALELQPPMDSPDAETRKLQVLASSQHELVFLGGHNYLVPRQRVTVAIRYVVPHHSEGLRRLLDMTSADASRISVSLVNNSWSGITVPRLDPAGATLEPKDENQEVWILSLDYDVTYYLL